MTRREIFKLVSEAVIDDPTLLPAVLDGLSQAAQTIASQHRGVRGYAKSNKFLDGLDKLLQDVKDDAEALMPEALR